MIEIIFLKFSSTEISKTGPKCFMQFFYWMGDRESDVTGSLSVNVQGVNDGVDEAVWQNNPLARKGWIQARAFIGERKKFMVISYRLVELINFGKIFIISFIFYRFDFKVIE